MKVLFLVIISLLDKFFPNLPTPKGRKQESSSSSSFQNVKVLTWNILAPCYTESLYQHRQSRRQRQRRQQQDENDLLQVLDWSYRKPRILQVLKDCKADIIFLQEVQLSYWQDEWSSSILSESSPSASSVSLADSFRSMGYSKAYIQKVKGEHPVANVILLSNTFLSPTTSSSSQSSGWQVKLVESRSRVLILQLQRNTTTTTSTNNEETSTENTQRQQQQSLFLLNVHLQASRDDEMTRFCQVRSLLKRLNVHSTTATSDTSTGANSNGSNSAANKNNSNNKNNDLIIMMGDFNMLKSGPVYHLLSTGKLPEENNELSHVTPRAPVAFLPLKDLYASTSTTMTPNHHHHHNSDSYKNRSSESSSMKENDENDDTTAAPWRWSLPSWTYAGWSILDYIFISDKDDIHLVEPLWGTRISPTLGNEEPIYDDDDNGDSNSNNKQEFRPPWLASRDYPHANLPSDHRPIGALLRMRNG